MPHNELLIKAIQHLYGIGVITKDKDIADKTGYNKATVSSYSNGRAKASLDFIRTFEKTFDLSLEDFSKDGKKEVIKKSDAMQLITENIFQIKAEIQTNRQLMIEILSAVSSRSVMDVQMMTEKLLEHNLVKIVHELRQGS